MEPSTIPRTKINFSTIRTDDYAWPRRIGRLLCWKKSPLEPSPILPFSDFRIADHPTGNRRRVNNASCSDLLDTKVACTSIISMYIADPGYFGNVMVVLDGDVEDRVIEQIPSPIRNHNNNILRLPGTKRPESVIYEYLMSLGNDHAIWQQVGNTSSGFSWQYFNDHGPDSKDYDGKDRDRYKKWFNDHIMFFESYHIIQHWIHDNPAEYKKFLNEFISSYNTLASRMMMPKIETVDPSL